MPWPWRHQSSNAILYTIFKLQVASPQNEQTILDISILLKLKDTREKKSQNCTKNSESSSCCLGSAHWDAPIFQMFFRHDIQQQKYELTYHSNVMRTKPIPIHTHLVILSVFCKQKHRFWCFSAPPLVFKNRSSYVNGSLMVLDSTIIPAVTALTERAWFPQKGESPAVLLNL